MSNEIYPVKQILMIGIPAVLILSIIITALIVQYRKIKSMSKKQRQIKDNKLYDLLIRLPLINKYIFKVNKVLTHAGIYSNEDIKNLTINYVKKGILSYAILFILGLLLYKDILTVLVITSFGYVFNDMFLMGHLKREYVKMLDELTIYISMLSQNYSSYNSVYEAVNITNPPKRIKEQAKEIKRILRSEKPMEDLMKYGQTAPNKILYTLAEISLLVSEIGGETLPNGKSNYITSLNTLSMTINIERRKHLQLQLAFKGIRFFTLIPLFVIWIIKAIVKNYVPALSVLIYGKYGYIATLVVLAISMIYYRKVDKGTDIEAINENDVHEVIEDLYAKKKVRDIIGLFIPTNVKKVEKIKELLNSSMSKHNLKTLYIQKVLLFMVSFVLCFSMIVIGTIYGKEFLKYSTIPMGFKVTDEYKESVEREVEKTDILFITQRGMTEEDLFASLKNIPGLKKNQIEAEYERILLKKKELEGTKVSMFDVFQALAVALIMYNMPNSQLKLRRKIIQIEAEDDVLQMLTLLSMYMYTSLDTQEVIKRLAKASRVYKNILQETSNFYIYDKDYAFALLNSKIFDVELIKISNRLKAAADGLALSEAFQALEEERDDILKRREVITKDNIEEKSAYLSPLSKRPLIAFIIGFILLPLGIFAATGMISFQNMGLL